MSGLTVDFLGRFGVGRRRWLHVLVITLVAGAAVRAPADEDAGLTDERVDEAIRRAVTWLKSQRNEHGHWERGDAKQARDWAGDSALVLLSLLYAGEDPRADDMAHAMGWLASQELHGTYTYGTRAHALALVRGHTYDTRLKGDLQWLLDAMWPASSEHPGCYDYTAVSKEVKKGRWDNSVSQFGVLGVWMAAEAGMRVPDSYWELVGAHWLRVQNHDGGWGYSAADRPSRGSMTAAGLTTLFVVLDQRYAKRPRDAAGVLSAIEAGMDWMGREYTPDNPHGGREWKYYYLYGVERVGRASGHKYFRQRDWFREGAAHLLEEQRDDGQWPASSSIMVELRNTAFALMFLCHGRAPLVYNKLQHGPDWNARMRDVAGLTRYTSKTYERLLNWQIVRLDGPLEDLLEAPVLYMRGASEWEFNEVEVQKIREYCQRGGLLFAVAGDGSAEFRESFEDLAQRAFPEHPARVVGAGHPLFSGAVGPVIGSPPLMLEVHNGVRTLMLFCTTDVAAAWSTYEIRGRGETDFGLGAAVYLYATDKTTAKSRLQTPNIPLRRRDIKRTISVARVKYDGPWNIEPYGWTRLRRYMNNETGTNLLVTSGVRLDSDALQDCRVAHITGTGAFKLSGAELRGLRRFLHGGGTLLADAAGGSREFASSLEEHLRAALRDQPRALSPESFLVTGAGLEDAIDLKGTGYRLAAHRAAGGREYPILYTFGSRRRYSVIYAPLDLSVGLLGTPVYGVVGYEPDSVLKVMRNMLLYAGLSSAEKAVLHREE